MKMLKPTLALWLALVSTPALAQSVEAHVSVCFTPAQKCEPLIVQAIDSAKTSIHLQAYGFTSLPIIKALQRAPARGVDVLAILDKVNNRKYGGGTLLLAAGIPVWIDSEPAIAQSRVIIVDGYLTIGGSYNYTASAERRNAENVTFTDSKVIASEFMENWNSRLQASSPMDAGG